MQVHKGGGGLSCSSSHFGPVFWPFPSVTLCWWSSVASVTAPSRRPWGMACPGLLYVWHELGLMFATACLKSLLFPSEADIAADTMSSTPHLLLSVLLGGCHGAFSGTFCPTRFAAVLDRSLTLLGNHSAAIELWGAMRATQCVACCPRASCCQFTGKRYEDTHYKASLST
jgi:hypothetical protein